LIAWDYAQAVAAIKGRVAEPAVDEYVGREKYLDVTGEQLAAITLERFGSSDVRALGPVPSKYRIPYSLAVDTEGTPSNPWSIQVSVYAGTGYVLRCTQPDFATGIQALQRVADSGTTIAIHNGMYDLEMCRVMGLDLYDAHLWDSMYAAYVLRVEPQGLKPLAYRWCGMEMKSYQDVVGDVGLEKQIDYLVAVSDLDTPDPEPRIIQDNDGTARLYKPQPLRRRAESILVDYYSEKLDKDGNRTDPYKRWTKQTPRDLREPAEDILGPMPEGTLGDLPLEDAVRYAARDPDATLRLMRALVPALETHDLTDLHRDGMDVLPVFEEMQSNGIPARKTHFEDLSEHVRTEMDKRQVHIAVKYYENRPFNPGSPKDVATLLRRRGLVPEKHTPTGKISTGKESIEHFRFTDDAIKNVIEWRELQKVDTGFCRPLIETFPLGVDHHPVRTKILTTRTTARRIAAKGINFLAIPIRHELGKRLRNGFEADEGCVFGAWDLSQIEMRYTAHVSRDPLLVKLFRDGRDIHAETAASVFGIPLADVDELEHRYPSKRAGFGILYGIQGYGLLDQLRMFGCKGWTVDKCDELIAEWLKLYKGVPAYSELCVNEARESGVVRDCWGMPRYVPEIWSDDSYTRAEAERFIMSHKVQGGAQGMIQKSMAWLKPYVRSLRAAHVRVEWLLQIHDELMFMFAEHLWEVMDPLVTEALTKHSLELIVPVEAKGGMAKRWGGLKG
jgi:DNA polymerase I-like protein with 3'-5' exonuclease and polymerase domains